jgi:diguanylate cyclase (GGDEF)-like protein
MTLTQIDPRDFPGSPYALELQRSRADLRFGPSREAEYSRAFLQRMRMRVRVWFTMVLLVRVAFELAQVRRTGIASPESILQLLLLLPCSAFLTWLAWSEQYERRYLRVTAYLLPLFYALIAVCVVRALSAGAFEQFAALAVAQIAIHFFAGVRFREALATNACLMIAFLLTAHLAHLPGYVLLKCSGVLTVTSVLVTMVSRDVEKMSRREFLEQALLGQLLTRDSLSGVMNRRAFDEHLRRVWLQALAQKSAIAVCMIDVDHFKRYNDAFGHQAGDAALSQIGGLIQEFAQRPLDVAARYGGEEFSLVLCDVSADQLQHLMERLRQRIQAERFGQPAAGSVTTGLTVSLGAAIVNPCAERTPQGAVQLADEALYEAKRGGRNRVVVRDAEDYRLMCTGKFQAIRLQAQA